MSDVRKGQKRKEKKTDQSQHPTLCKCCQQPLSAPFPCSLTLVKGKPVKKTKQKNSTQLLTAKLKKKD